MSIDGDGPFRLTVNALSMRRTHDLAFFCCSTAQKNLPHIHFNAFKIATIGGLQSNNMGKFLQRKFVMSIICKSNYDDVSFHLEY